LKKKTMMMTDSATTLRGFTRRFSHMRMFLSLVAAWLVASLAFAFAWLRFADLESSWYFVRRALNDFGILIGILLLVVGLPIAFVLSRRQLVRWWSASGLGAAFGAMLGFLTTRGGSGNPFGLSFSPWTRNRPGFIGEFDVPWSAADTWGSVAFGVIVGGLLGLTFWYVYMRLLAPDTSRS
jgi:hypothetical protein